MIEYYARYGHDARVKMFHCVKSHPNGAGSPYDLTVVAKEALPLPKAGSIYYTMSASGVVQVWERQGGSRILRICSMHAMTYRGSVQLSTDYHEE